MIVVSHNTQGFFPRFEDIKYNTLLKSADIVAMQETWINDKQSVNCPLEYHNLLVSNRQKKERGGVALLVHQDLFFKSIDTSKIKIECIAIEILSPHISVYNVYRPPHMPLPFFYEELTELLKCVEC